MTHEERVQKYCEKNLWWIPNFHRLGFMYANGFIGEKTYNDLIVTKIRKFNGKLATINKALEEHYSKK